MISLCVKLHMESETSYTVHDLSIFELPLDFMAICRYYLTGQLHKIYMVWSILSFMLLYCLEFLFNVFIEELSYRFLSLDMLYHFFRGQSSCDCCHF